jgi:hypothetical protein
MIKTVSPVHSSFLTLQVAYSEFFSEKLHKFVILSPSTRKPKIKEGIFG